MAAFRAPVCFINLGLIPYRHCYCTYRFAIPPPIAPLIHDCAVGAFYYLGSECDHLPEAGNNIYWYPSLRPSIRPRAFGLYKTFGFNPRLFIVGAAEGGERRQTNTPKAY